MSANGLPSRVFADYSSTAGNEQLLVKQHSEDEEGLLPSLRGGAILQKSNPMALVTVTAKTHDWAFGALAELLDNSVDELKNGATFVKVDACRDPSDASEHMLVIEDDGAGMSPQRVTKCMSVGFSMGKSADAIGQFGNGFKSGTMRLGQCVTVFTKNRGKGGDYYTVGMLSLEFSCHQNRVEIPQIEFTADLKPSWCEHEGDAKRKQSWNLQLDHLMTWSPFKSLEEVLEQLKSLPRHNTTREPGGTRVFISKLWHHQKGSLELDFDDDKHDIKLRGYSKARLSEPMKDENGELLTKQEKKNDKGMAEAFKHETALRAYLQILYRGKKLKPNASGGMAIYLRGKPVEPKPIEATLQYHVEDSYQPKGKDGKKVEKAKGIWGMSLYSCVKPDGQKDDTTNNTALKGICVYVRGRLITYYKDVVANNWSTGRGTVGVWDAPSNLSWHNNKQKIEENEAYKTFVNKMKEKAIKYWEDNAHKVGYRTTKFKKAEEDKKGTQRLPRKEKGRTGSHRADNMISSDSDSDTPLGLGFGLGHRRRDAQGAEQRPSAKTQIKIAQLQELVEKLESTDTALTTHKAKFSKDVLTTKRRLDEETTARTKVEQKLASTQEELKKAHAEIARLKHAADVSKDNDVLEQTARDLMLTQQQMSELQKANSELKAANEELQNKLDFKTCTVELHEVNALRSRKEIRDLQQQLLEANANNSNKRIKVEYP